MAGYVPRYTKRIDQFHKRERILLGALKRGEDQQLLVEAAEALREAKLGMIKSAKANRRKGISASSELEKRWHVMPPEKIIDEYRHKGSE